MLNGIGDGSEGHSPGARWAFDLGAGTVAWAGAIAPEIRALRRVRGVRSRRGGRHVPTWAYSTTLQRHVQLESGVEHDLLRELDRDEGTVWLVPQPARITFARDEMVGGRAWHVPDLLSLTDDGTVTVWDVRPAARQDEKFRVQVAKTAQACAEFGWGHRVFDGMSVTRRVNLMWLDGYRREMPWYGDALAHLRATRGPDVTLDQVVTLDQGRGHVLSACWHAVRNGVLTCDLDEPLGPSTVLTWRVETTGAGR